MTEVTMKTITLGDGLVAREQVVIDVDPKVWVSIDEVLEATNPDDGYGITSLRDWLASRGAGDQFPWDRGLEGAEDEPDGQA